MATKKIICTVLSLAMIITQFSLTAFAAEVDDGDRSYTAESGIDSIWGDDFPNLSTQDGSTRSAFALSEDSEETETDLTLGMSSLQEGQSTFEDYFPDSALAHQVASALRMNVSDAVTEEQLANVAVINNSGGSSKISDLTGIHYLKGMVYLNIEGNRVSELPDTFTQLENLIWLNVRGNTLTALPEDIGELQNLTFLWAAENRLTRLPDSIVELSKLDNLRLSGNQLTALPLQIGNLQELIWLDLSLNQLTNLPSSIYQLQNLQTFSLHGNKIKSISSYLGKMISLKNLFLSENQIQCLPNVFGSLDQLELFWMRGNQLTDIPSSLYDRIKNTDLEYYFHQQVGVLKKVSVGYNTQITAEMLYPGLVKKGMEQGQFPQGWNEGTFEWTIRNSVTGEVVLHFGGMNNDTPPPSQVYLKQGCYTVELLTGPHTGFTEFLGCHKYTIPLQVTRKCCHNNTCKKHRHQHGNRWGQQGWR